MNILTPISGIEDIKILETEGANEFFAGYINQEWIELFNDLQDENGNMQLTINRRNGLRANIRDFHELCEAVKLTKEVKGRLYITVNAPFYTENMYPFLRRYFQELSNAGVERLIVSDIGIMEILAEEFEQFKITVSCLAQVVNNSQVEFFKQFGVERIVFPRHMPIKNIISIVEHFPELEFECFGFCEKCLHDDGNCRCMHNMGAICMECWNSVYETVDGKEISLELKQELLLNEALYKDWMQASVALQNDMNLGCSLCSVGVLMKYPNISTFKLSGRGKGISFVVDAVRITKDVITFCQKEDSVEKVQKFVQEKLGSRFCQDYTYCIMRGE